MLQLWTLLTKEERNIVRKKREGPTDLVKHAYFKNKQCTVHQNKSLNPLFEKKIFELSLHFRRNRYLWLWNCLQNIICFDWTVMQEVIDKTAFAIGSPFSLETSACQNLSN